VLGKCASLKRLLRERAMNRPYPWKCPNCRERALRPRVTNYQADIEHDGRVYHIAVKALPVLRCDHCGTQQLPEEAQERLFQELRRQAGLLAPSQITEKRINLGLSQKDFAKLIGVAKETVCRWESGGQIQQRVMNEFMEAVFDVPELRRFLKRRRGWEEHSVSRGGKKSKFMAALERRKGGQR
jgi:putative zinc finger/helix-turn-helix YgiT family protein